MRSARGEYYASEVRDLWLEDPEAAQYIEALTGQRTPETIYAWALGEYEGAARSSWEPKPNSNHVTWGIFLDHYDDLMNE